MSAFVSGWLVTIRSLPIAPSLIDKWGIQFHTVQSESGLVATSLTHIVSIMKGRKSICPNCWPFEIPWSGPKLAKGRFDCILAVRLPSGHQEGSPQIR